MPGISETLIVLIVFTAPAIPILVIGMIYYHKKKLEHKEVLAAIEKGVPISELSIGPKKQDKSAGPGWVQDQSKGITLLVISIGIGFVFWLALEPWYRAGLMNVLWIMPVVFLGNGVGLIMRSKQRRKYEKPAPAEELSENNTDRSNDSAVVQ